MVRVRDDECPCMTEIQMPKVNGCSKWVHEQKAKGDEFMHKIVGKGDEAAPVAASQDEVEACIVE
jgi:hypothetical protein